VKALQVCACLREGGVWYWRRTWAVPCPNISTTCGSQDASGSLMMPCTMDRPTKCRPDSEVPTFSPIAPPTALSSIRRRRSGLLTPLASTI